MWLGAASGLLYYRFDEHRRAVLRDNLRRVLGPSATPAELERVVRRGFASYGRYWGEAFRLETLSQEDIRNRMIVDGREHLDAAFAAGHGEILAVPHLGNWDAGAAWVVAAGYPLTTVVERLKPAELFDRFVAYRRALGMEILPLDNGSESMRGLLRALRENRIVALVTDRDLTGHGLPVRMFGTTVMMPGGPASLSLKTGAPLLPAGVFQDRKGGRWVSIIRPAIRIEPSGDQRADVLALTQRLADEFEQLIRLAPEQWHMLSRFWRAEGSGEPQGPEGSGEPQGGAPVSRDPVGRDPVGRDPVGRDPVGREGEPAAPRTEPRTEPPAAEEAGL
jgi:lauroyl/myristoyl acyltransferase